jgi:hypothetical protein
VRTRERRGIYRVLVGKPEGKRTLGRPRRRWEDNIKVDLQQIGCRGIHVIELVEWGNLRERDHLGDPGVDGRIILRWIFSK